MGFPVTAGILNPPIQIDFADDNGLVITIPPESSAPGGNVTFPPGTEGTVSVPPNPAVCVSLAADGQYTITVAAGLTVSFPTAAAGEILINSQPPPSSGTQSKRAVVRFPSGGELIVFRPKQSMELPRKLTVTGTMVSMDPLP